VRPVNLIPPEDRRGEGAPMRSGGLAYVVVGVLVVGLAAVCGVVFLNKQVADREAEVAALEAESSDLRARAQSLSRFVAFQQVHDARIETVGQLARSRFDWERVLRELTLVLPKGIWLTNLTGSVSPEAAAGESENPLRAEIAGPALELAGCARTHRDVARLIAAMEDIDGVTRVTATDSEKSDSVTPPTATAGGQEPLTNDDCRTRSTIPTFNLIAAFDGVAPPPSSTAPAAPAPEASPTAAAPDADAAAQQTEARDSVEEAEDRTEQATDLVPGG
jgi:Tfp pilus assembly protein PilN